MPGRTPRSGTNSALVSLAAWLERAGPPRPPELVELIEAGVIFERDGVLVEVSTHEPLDANGSLPALIEDAGWPGRDQETDE